MRNPLHQYLAERKQKQQEEAARAVSKAVQSNTHRLIHTLAAVDFLHGDLPTDIPTGEGSQLSPLEQDTRCLIQLLQQAPPDICMDIRPIDEKLLTLAQMFRQFVDHGDATAAATAMDALRIGIHDIRCKLPLSQPDLAETFVNTHAAYLDEWIALVGLAQKYDRTLENLKIQEAALREAVAEKEQLRDSIEQHLKAEPDFCAAFLDIQHERLPADPSLWSGIQLEVHQLLRTAHQQDFNADLHQRRFYALQDDLLRLKQQMDASRTQLAFLPGASDLPVPAETDSVWAQLAPDGPAFDSLPADVREELTCATQRILNRHLLEQQRLLRQQEVKEMPISDLVRDLFGEDVLNKIANHESD